MVYPTIDPIATGKRIKELRVQRGYTVAQVAEYMGFNNEQAIYKWQRGESLPSIDNLYALSVLFGTAIDNIIVGSRSREEEREISLLFFVNLNKMLISDK